MFSKILWKSSWKVSRLVMAHASDNGEKLRWKGQFWNISHPVNIPCMCGIRNSRRKPKSFAKHRLTLHISHEFAVRMEPTIWELDGADSLALTSAPPKPQMYCSTLNVSNHIYLNNVFYLLRCSRSIYIRWSEKFSRINKRRHTRTQSAVMVANSRSLGSKRAFTNWYVVSYKTNWNLIFRGLVPFPLFIESWREA